MYGGWYRWGNSRGIFISWRMTWAFPRLSPYNSKVHRYRDSRNIRHQGLNFNSLGAVFTLFLVPRTSFFLSYQGWFRSGTKSLNVRPGGKARAVVTIVAILVLQLNRDQGFIDIPRFQGSSTFEISLSRAYPPIRITPSALIWGSTYFSITTTFASTLSMIVSLKQLAQRIRPWELKFWSEVTLVPFAHLLYNCQ